MGRAEIFTKEIDVHSKKNLAEVRHNDELGISVRVIQNDDGSISINAEDAAIGYGWVQVQNKKGKQYTSVRWETLNGYCNGFGFPNILGKGDYIPESLFYMLGFKAGNERAVKFQKWLATEVLPSIRKNGMYAEDDLLDNPDLLLKVVMKLKTEREAKRLAEQRAQELEAELDQNKDWYSIKRVAALNGVEWRTFDWRKLKSTGLDMGYEVKKIFDANYGEVNTYHREVWEAVYPEYEI